MKALRYALRSVASLMLVLSIASCARAPNLPTAEMKLAQDAIERAEKGGARRYALSDLQLALWPTEAVRAALPAGWTLADSASTRVLSEADTVRTSISYSNTPRWSGTISLNNQQYDYHLTIRSAVQR